MSCSTSTSKVREIYAHDGQKQVVLTQHAKSGHCECSIHAKCGPSTKSGHTRGPLLVLTSDSDSSPLKIQELTIKLWGIVA